MKSSSHHHLWSWNMWSCQHNIYRWRLEKTMKSTDKPFVVTVKHLQFISWAFICRLWGSTQSYFQSQRGHICWLITPMWQPPCRGVWWSATLWLTPADCSDKSQHSCDSLLACNLKQPDTPHTNIKHPHVRGTSLCTQ